MNAKIDLDKLIEYLDKHDEECGQSFYCYSCGKSAQEDLKEFTNIKNLSGFEPMNAKHTQGKWFIVDNNFVYTLNKNGHNRFTALLQAGRDDNNNFINKEELKANAQLIAAAPELLEACKYVLIKLENEARIADNTDIFSNERELLRQAIVKAEK